LERIKHKLATLPEVLFISLSISGKGLFLFIPVFNPNKHKEHYEALVKTFCKIGINIDAACSNVNRLRCITYDPEAVINLNAKVYRNVYEREITKGNYSDGIKNIEIKKLDNWIQSKYGAFGAGNRHEFIFGSASCYHRFNITENEALNELMKYACKEFPQKEIIRVVRSIYKKNHTPNSHDSLYKTYTG